MTEHTPKRPKRPRDLNQWAKRMVDIATGEVENLAPTSQEETGRSAMSTPIKRTILERFDVPDSNYETVMMLVEVPPQVNTGLHTHPGFDAAYLLEGNLTVIVLGQPDKRINAGESWHIPPGIVHEVKAGNETVKVLATYVVEKGKPLATPYTDVAR